MATAGRSLANKNAKITLKSISYAFLADLENKTILKYRKKEGICRLVVIFSSYGKVFAAKICQDWLTVCIIGIIFYFSLPGICQSPSLARREIISLSGWHPRK
jgi:hypothetical protein